MPAIEISDLHQTALLWESTGTDAYNEVVVAGTPVEVKVRWEYVRHEMLGPDGDPVALDARVVGSQDIPVNSLMWLGASSEWYGTGSTGDDSEVMQVVALNHTPDIKNRHLRRVYGLMKYKDAPPRV